MALRHLSTTAFRANVPTRMGEAAPPSPRVRSVLGTRDGGCLPKDLPRYLQPLGPFPSSPPSPATPSAPWTRVLRRTAWTRCDLAAACPNTPSHAPPAALLSNCSRRWPTRTTGSTPTSSSAVATSSTPPLCASVSFRCGLLPRRLPAPVVRCGALPFEPSRHSESLTLLCPASSCRA